MQERDEAHSNCLCGYWLLFDLLWAIESSIIQHCINESQLILHSSVQQTISGFAHSNALRTREELLNTIFFSPKSEVNTRSGFEQTTLASVAATLVCGSLPVVSRYSKVSSQVIDKFQGSTSVTELRFFDLRAQHFEKSMKSLADWLKDRNAGLTELSIQIPITIPDSRPPSSSDRFTVTEHATPSLYSTKSARMRVSSKYSRQRVPLVFNKALGHSANEEPLSEPEYMIRTRRRTRELFEPKDTMRPLLRDTPSKNVANTGRPCSQTWIATGVQDMLPERPSTRVSRRSTCHKAPPSFDPATFSPRPLGGGHQTNIWADPRSATRTDRIREELAHAKSRLSDWLGLSDQE